MTEKELMNRSEEELKEYLRKLYEEIEKTRFCLNAKRKAKNYPSPP